MAKGIQDQLKQYFEHSQASHPLSRPDEALWELIFESLPDMVALIDSRNRLMKANRAMLRFMEVSQIQALGSQCFHFMHNRSCSLENCPHNKMMHDGQVHEEEIFEPRTKSYLHITTTPVFSGDGRLLGSVHIARDITSQKMYEEKLEQYNRELEELNQSKDKFFSIVAHDLRSPFQGVIGFADLILDCYSDLQHDEVIRYIRNIKQSSHEAYVMLENLLNWSRLQTGRMNFNSESLNLAGEVSRVINLLNSNALRKNVTICNLVQPKLKVKADKQMLFSIFLNLISNAIKFSFAGKQIEISVEDVVFHKQDVHLTESPANKFIQVNITDHGTGMNAETIRRVMSDSESVTTAGTNNETGAGIGLVIVREMVAKHGSPLQVKSIEGEGTTFWFRLPLA